MIGFIRYVEWPFSSLNLILSDLVGLVGSSAKRIPGVMSYGVLGGRRNQARLIWGWLKVLDQLTLDDIEKQHFKGFAEKVEVQRVMLACSVCLNYVGKDDYSCPRCKSLFVGGL